jgi:hypothetical protein
MHDIRSGLRRTASPADDFGSTACASQSTLELNINPEPIHQSQMLYISFIPFTGTNVFFSPVTSWHLTHPETSHGTGPAHRLGKNMRHCELAEAEAILHGPF